MTLNLLATTLFRARVMCLWAQRVDGGRQFRRQKATEPQLRATLWLSGFLALVANLAASGETSDINTRRRERASTYGWSDLMAPNDLLVLLILWDHSKGLLVPEIIAGSGGVLPRGTIYVLLDKLAEQGLVSSNVLPPAAGYRAPRRQHAITAKGRAHVNRYLSSLNLKRMGQPMPAVVEPVRGLVPNAALTAELA